MININYTYNKKYKSLNKTFGEIVKLWNCLYLKGHIVNIKILDGEVIAENKKINNATDLCEYSKYFDLKVQSVNSYLEIGDHYIDILLRKEVK